MRPTLDDAVPRLSAALADRYTIERELGAGGMATVYLAADLKHHRRVALKVLRPELSAILGGERFLKEIQLTANLQHPHILSLYDSGEADGLVFYVMPYIEGESLRDRLNKEKQLPVEEAVRIATQVAGALDYAHRHGVVHRDIKPENILLHDGSALVADFGIALAASTAGGSTRMTETGMSLGTPHYMAPEQAMGEREITPKADIYALGCVLYELLTAEPPFVGATAQAIIARVMTEEPRSLTMQRRTIPPHVEAATRTALEKLPADRFATAAQFAEALGKSDYALPATRVGAAAKAPRRGAKAMILATMPWAIAAVAVAVGARGWFRPTPAATVTRQRVVLWNQSIAAGWLGTGLAIAPRGGLIVYADTVGGQQQLWAKEPDRANATVLAGTAGARHPVFSPDGAWIAFIADGKVKKVPLLGGSAVTIADSAQRDIPALAWLDDGTILYNDPGYGIRAGTQDGGPSRRLARTDSTGRGVISITPLPGGRGALVGTCAWGCPESDLRVLDLRSGALTVLAEEVLKGWSIAGGRVVFVRRDGGVFVAPFDEKTLAFSSAPVPVFEGVRIGLGVADMALAADGTLLYASGGAQATLTAQPAWVGRDGQVTVMDTSWSFTPAANGGVALSPDGRRLAVAIRTGGVEDIWIKELDRGPLTRLTFGGSNVRPHWTADGRAVMYLATAIGATSDLRRRRADGTGGEDSLYNHARPIWEVVRLADTTQFVIRLGAPPTRDIYLFRRGDTALTRLVASDGYEEVAPAIAPDGRWMAYASNESGRYEVYVRPFPAADAGRWQVSRNGGTEPAWSHSGRELFYRDGTSLVSATVQPGATFTLGEQRPLFRDVDLATSTSHREYEVSPDDRRFLFLRLLRPERASEALTLVQVGNWFAELNAPTARRP